MQFDFFDPLYVLLLDKALAAMFTFKSFVAIVSADVVHQMRFLFERFVTPIALEGPLSGVDASMPLQAVLAVY